MIIGSFSFTSINIVDSLMKLTLNNWYLVIVVWGYWSQVIISLTCGRPDTQEINHTHVFDSSKNQSVLTLSISDRINERQCEPTSVNWYYSNFASLLKRFSFRTQDIHLRMLKFIELHKELSNHSSYTKWILCFINRKPWVKVTDYEVQNNMFQLLFS